MTYIPPLLPTLPNGTNNIGNVGIDSSIPAGSNLIGSVDVSNFPSGFNINNSTDSSGNITSTDTTVSTTATQLSTDTALIEEITIILDVGATGILYVGSSALQNIALSNANGYPQSISYRKAKPSNIYAKSSTGSILTHLTYGGV